MFPLPRGVVGRFSRIPTASFTSFGLGLAGDNDKTRHLPYAQVFMAENVSKNSLDNKDTYVVFTVHD